MSTLGSVGLEMTMSSRAMIEGALKVASGVNAGVVVGAYHRTAGGHKRVQLDVNERLQRGDQ